MGDKSFEYIYKNNLEVLKTLEESRLFSHIPHEIIEQLIPISSLVEHPAGEAILVQGEDNKKVFFLLRGEVEISVDGEKILQLKRKGDIFGEMSIISNKPCSATVTTLTKAQIFSIQGRDIGSYTQIDQKEISNILYRLFAEILVDKLTLTTFKAKKFEEASHREKEANLEKSRYLAIMSHEIRNPLNGIIGMGNLLQDTNLDSEQDEFAQIIRTSSENLLTIINDVLDFSKLEAEKFILDEHPLSPQNLIEESLDIVSIAASHKKIELLYHISKEIPTSLLGDSTRIRQILINLTNNAIKFTPQGMIIINLNLQSAEEEHLVLCCEVIDSGIGIPEDRKQMLFKPFTQVEASTAQHYGGTGLGLAICKELCSKMGGDIQVESEVGKGACFSFTMRLKKDPKTLIKEEASICRGIKVWILNNHLEARQAIERLLNRLGAIPQYLATKEELEIAVQQSKEEDLWIMDLNQRHLLDKNISSLLCKKRVLFMGFYGEPLRAEEWNDSQLLLHKPFKEGKLIGMLRILMNDGLNHSNKKKSLSAKHEKIAEMFPMKILIAEDVRSNQRLLLHIMANFGYDVEIVNNGAMALESLKQQAYDLVFMDINMPEMNGVEATKQILAQYQGQPPIIIAVTGNVMSSDKASYLEAGMNDYLSKPFEISAISNILKKWGAKIQERKG